jgi:hypothetical protein
MFAKANRQLSNSATGGMPSFAAKGVAADYERLKSATAGLQA